MRTYVSTLGFHETRVTRPVLRYGLDDDDAVVLLRPADERDSNRGADAVDYVNDMLSEVAPGASIAVERIDAADFVAAVMDCSDVLREAEGRLIVNFGGGAREVFLPLTIATVLCAPLVDVALQYTDVDQQIRELPVLNLTASIPPTAKPTLELIARAGDEISLPELASASEKSKSTVTRHVDQLADRRLVETRKDGKTKHVQLSPTGRLLLCATTVEDAAPTTD